MANGGIIGPINITSFGKCTVTTKTSSGSITTQPGTRLIQSVIVGGGGGGNAGFASEGGGGSGGGGIATCEIAVSGNTSYCATVGGGGAGGPPSQPTSTGIGSAGNASSIVCVPAGGGLTNPGASGC